MGNINADEMVLIRKRWLLYLYNFALYCAKEHYPTKPPAEFSGDDACSLGLAIKYASDVLDYGIEQTEQTAGIRFKVNHGSVDNG